MFDSFFGGARSHERQRGPASGADLRFNMELSFEEAVFGAEKEIEFQRLDTCDRCSGRGAEPGTDFKMCPDCQGAGEIRRAQQSVFGQFVSVSACSRCMGEGKTASTPCVDCRGIGRIQSVRKMNVTIPAGVDDGTQVRLRGEGEAGPHGGEHGSLFVVLSVKQHEQFERHENEILLEQAANIAQASLGARVKIPTLDGEMELELPSGTQSGDQFRIPGKGVPRLRSNGRGDMFVRVIVVTPEELTEDQRELLEKLGTTMGTPTLPHRQKGFFERIKDAVAG